MNKPFLKWAGSKRKSIDFIKENLGISHNRLVEPFVGSGAIFLNTDYDEYLLCDLNKDLINLYNILIDNGHKFIDVCSSFFTGEYNNEEDYYKFREHFNNTENVEYKSILFLYLNRHCFNGLCRYNKSGKFNVPFGRYKKPYFQEMSYYLL